MGWLQDSFLTSGRSLAEVPRCIVSRSSVAQPPQGRPAARRGLSAAKSSPEDDGADAPAGDKK
jgi:hypothetical protein